jgi:hypothetical protein
VAQNRAKNKRKKRMALIIGITQHQLDTLESDPQMFLKFPTQCPGCRQKLECHLVKLGSVGDRSLNERQTLPLLWQVANFLPNLLLGNATAGKIIRLRLKPEQIARLRQRISLTAKSPCPHCHLRFDIQLQPR